MSGYVRYGSRIARRIALDDAHASARRDGRRAPGEQAELVIRGERLGDELLAGGPSGAENGELQIFGTLTPTSESRVMMRASSSSLQPSVPAGRIGTTT